MKYIDIIKSNRELSEKVTGRPYRIGVITNITVAHIKDVLELELRMEGINAFVTLGDYDSIVQDSSKFAGFDAVIIFWEAVNFLSGIHNRAESFTLDEYEALAIRLEEEVSFVLQNLKNTPLVLINKFSANAFNSGSLNAGVLSKLCVRMNGFVETTKVKNHLVVDTDLILVDLGRSSSIDDRQFQYAKSLYYFDFLKAYVTAVKPAFLSVLGRAKKILVMDCDNTLWRGVVGEDGSEGILMADTNPKGIAFSEVQILVKGMREDGILLAICSKNNIEDVEDIFQNHPDMILEEADLVAKKVNWRDKASNIEEIAQELNIGLDSFVFIDDSSFEIDLVRQALPDVVCVQVPKNLSEYPSLVRQLKPLFFNLSKTSEDNKKTTLYQQENQRKKQSRAFASMTDYLGSLELKLTVSSDLNVPVGRVAQLTQKTNQFNLTTKRYTEANIQSMVDDNSFRVYSFELSDRFGEYGTTGVAIVKLDDNDECASATLNTLLMSCRVIARDAEYRFVGEIIKHLQKSNVTRLYASYCRTLKNAQVSNLYGELGFDVVSVGEVETLYCLNLEDYVPKEIPHISLIGK